MTDGPSPTGTGNRGIPRFPVPVASVVALERLSTRTWVADDVEEVGGWILRAAEGFTGRANSALVLRDPGADLDDLLAAVAGWYVARGLPPRLSLPLPTFADLGERLAGQGWAFEWGAHVLVRDLDGLGVADASTPVDLDEAPSAAWMANYHYRGSDLPPAARRVLARGEAVAFASIRDGGEVVAIARGAVADDWLGVFAVETAPTHRRRGLASALLGALADWGRARGATRTFLQVDLGNPTALAVYERAGFAPHHDYHYLGRQRLDSQTAW